MKFDKIDIAILLLVVVSMGYLIFSMVRYAEAL